MIGVPFINPVLSVSVRSKKKITLRRDVVDTIGEDGKTLDGTERTTKG